MTRKQLDQLQNAFFGKIPRGEWVKLMAVVERWPLVKVRLHTQERVGITVKFRK